MPRVDLVVRTLIKRTPRARQLEALFDVPAVEQSEREWHGDVPLDARDWNVGLIVGLSGSGKSTILRDMFAEPATLTWAGASVIEDFDRALSMKEIADMCQAVGFNTIPAWLRPYSVLSNGERFRVELARRMLETTGVVAVDEFTSVVDRQVAKIGAHAVQKAIRRSGKRFVAASCHYDILDWLQPDWTLEPASMTFTWRELRRRPNLTVELRHVEYRAWELFAPFHYLTVELNHAARCWCLFVDEEPVSFAAVLHRPTNRPTRIKGVSRLVTLPDWQGLGLALILVDQLGALYAAQGFELRTYPEHPALIRSFDRSSRWKLEKKPGRFSSRPGETGNAPMGGRPCAVFSYCGEASDPAEGAPRSPPRGLYS
jgi:ABC-type lipoprotein export system ATPase subunit